MRLLEAIRGFWPVKILEFSQGVRGICLPCVHRALTESRFGRPCRFQPGIFPRLASQGMVQVGIWVAPAELEKGNNHSKPKPNTLHALGVRSPTRSFIMT